METGPQATISEALARLWAKFLPEILERVSVLERAGAALGSGPLGEDERAEAVAAAHKLAGVLGTFGLAEGTALAREAEAAYSENLAIDAGGVARLQRIARQLDEVVRAHA